LSFDEKSVDHADLGEQIVRDKGIFGNLNKEERSIILSSIKGHNKLSLSEDLNEKERFYLLLLRDADKLDIWKVLIEHYKSEDKHNNPVLLDLPDIPNISNNVYNAIENKQLVKKEYIQSVNDFIILNMSWIFDLNFSFTFQEVIKRNYISILSDLLPDTMQSRKITKMVNGYIKTFSTPEFQIINNRKE